VNKYSEEDKTEWFPGTVWPARAGVYERRYYRDDAYIAAARFAYDGFWCSGRLTLEMAAISDGISAYQSDMNGDDFEWRGLKYDPNEPYHE
jgi:hypothetical protein